MIVLTSDIDWAPDEVIAYMLDLFEQYNVRYTLFATHETKEISIRNKNIFEIAIHPNFNPLLEGGGGSIDKILDDILSIYPDAKGVRSHSMTQSSVILSKFVEKGLLYDATQLEPYGKVSKPFVMWNGLIRIPCNWADDLHSMYGFSFDDSRIEFKDNGLNVLIFHPIHVFLNTESPTRYIAAKKSYHEPKKLLEYRNKKMRGTKDLLVDLLQYIKVNKIQTKTLIQIAKEFRKNGKQKCY